ncbi:MAG: hypothetical protein QOC67_2411 [Pseudonocardiales bacterium]|jgi:hydroxyacyl-ACP dehydratase HTD2-like protein with hotdog domain|nr:hypothetical protein [Pseudonocardiales bacterium]
MFLFGVAYWTSHRIHYDPEWARAEGFGDLLVTANLLSAYSVEGVAGWRDTRVQRILAGSSEVMRHIVGRSMRLDR